MSDDCHLYYTATKLELTGDVTTELAWGCPLTLLPFNSGCRSEAQALPVTGTGHLVCSVLQTQVRSPEP